MQGYIEHIAQQLFPEGYALQAGVVHRQGTPAEVSGLQKARIAERSYALITRRQVSFTRENVALEMAVTQEPVLLVKSDLSTEKPYSLLFYTAGQNGIKETYEGHYPVLHKGDIQHLLQANGTNLNVRYVIHYTLITNL